MVSSAAGTHQLEEGLRGREDGALTASDPPLPECKLKGESGCLPPPPPPLLLLLTCPPAAQLWGTHGVWTQPTGL